MLESDYQGNLIKEIERRLPGCFILKNDTDYQPGIPDLSVFYYIGWAWLEVKPEEPSGPEDFEPNQEWFVEEARHLSFGAVIYPENEKEVLDGLVQYLSEIRRATCPA